MSKSGIYKFDRASGTVVKVSDRIPNTQVFDVHVPCGGYMSENIGHKPEFIESRAHKRRLLKERGLREVGELSRREL